MQPSQRYMPPIVYSIGWCVDQNHNLQSAPGNGQMIRPRMLLCHQSNGLEINRSSRLSVKAHCFVPREFSAKIIDPTCRYWGMVDVEWSCVQAGMKHLLLLVSVAGHRKNKWPEKLTGESFIESAKPYTS